MSTYSFPPDLQQLIDARLATGSYHSEDELLRDALRALAEESEDLAAVQEAVAEWRAGDAGVPLRDGFVQVREGRTPTR